MQTEYILKAMDAALAAGKEILNVYNDPSSDFQVERKADNSPLTLADRKAHETIMTYLQETDYPVLSEVGVIYVPVKETLYWGEVATGAYKMEGVTGRAGRSLEEMKASAFRMPCAETNEVFVIVASRSHLSAETEEYIEEKRKIYPHVELVSVGSSIKICKVCEGLADEYPRFAPTMEWDTAAGHAIAKASGAEIYQAGKEEPLKYNKPDLLNPWFVVKRN